MSHNSEDLNFNGRQILRICFWSLSCKRRSVLGCRSTRNQDEDFLSLLGQVLYGTDIFTVHGVRVIESRERESLGNIWLQITLKWTKIFNDVGVMTSKYSWVAP
jgi:hypothetical protein